LSVSSLANVVDWSESVLLSERLHQCFFSPLVVLLVSLLLFSEPAAEPEAMNSAREMRPSASVSSVLNCDAPGPKLELAFVSPLAEPLVEESMEPEEPVLPDVDEGEAVIEDEEPLEEGELVLERLLLPLPVLELEFELPVPELEFEPPLPELPDWARAETVSRVRPLRTAAKVREVFIGWIDYGLD
jgi:hypothetical protein